MTLTPRLFWGVILCFITVRLAFAALNYRGDTSPESRERALKYFSEEVIEKGTEYHRAGFAVSVLYFLLSEGFLVLFLLLGGSSLLAERCQIWSGGRPALQVAFYLTVLSMLTGLLSLPFTYYFGYVLEHRFGFSKLTLGGWIVFQLKGALVSWVMTLLIGSLAYAILRRFPRGWVWIIPAGALILQFTLTYLFPRLILPLFYKIEPIHNPELGAAITRVADRAGVKLKSLYLINESKYSSHTNAFFTGFGKFKEIYLYDTLLKDHSNEEVAAILAHELGHWKHNHVLKGLALSELGIILACLLLYYVFPVIARAEFLKAGPIENIASLPLLLLIASIAGYFVNPISNSVSRHFERQADRAGLELSHSPDVLIRDFKQLAVSNRSDLLPHPLTVFWNYSHPPIVDRIESIERMASGS
ncbi:M48 family metallopeptidase [Candidatus Sumerlaeota bacterium]|nr:M48 family metallopeptidase [Candidatus Sumerlaeota bacterium]